MIHITHLSTKLWSIRDAVIDAVLSGNEPPAEISSIYEWLENDGWTELVDRNPNGDLAVSIYSFCYDDAELRALLDIDDLVPVSDEMRIQLTREGLRELKSDSISYEYPEITFCRIEGKDRRSVVLGATFENQPGGCVVHWMGVYKNAEQFINAMKFKGLWPLNEVGMIDDESILRFWRK